MANESQTQTLKLDLDVKGFTEGVLKAEGSLKTLGSTDSLTGILENIKGMGLALGAIGASAYAVKAAFDAVFEAERIEKINQQFEIFSKNAGLSADVIRNDLTKAVGGLADDTDVIEAANKALVSMGSSAKDLGKTMELARKITATMGGDLIQNFENLNQALASGQTRMLRQYGLIIDSDKAYRDYARSIGKFKDDLTEAEKRQAIMNATLTKGQTTFKGVKTDTDTLTMTWKKFMVTINEIKETFVKAFDKMFGPTIRAIFKEFTAEVMKFSTALKEQFAEGSEKSALKVQRLKTALDEVDTNMERLNSKKDKYQSIADKELFDRMYGQYASRKAALQKEISELEATIPQETPKSAVIDTGDKEAAEERLKTQEKFQADILKLKQQSIDEQIKTETDYDNVQQERQQQLVVMHEEITNRIRQIDEEYRAQGQEESESNMAARTSAYEAYAARVRELQDQMYNDEIRVSQNAAKEGNSASTRFEAGWKLGGLKAGKALSDWSAHGQAARKALSNSLEAGFAAMGDGSKSVADAMRDAFLGQIGDQATAQGSMMLAEGIWPPNPLELAAGGALVALGAKLKSMSSSSKVSPEGGGGGGGGGIPDMGAAPEAPMQQQLEQQQKNAKQVAINVHGSYFDTQETRRQLMEMVREETDKADFNYFQITQGAK